MKLPNDLKIPYYFCLWINVSISFFPKLISDTPIKGELSEEFREDRFEGRFD